jgi:hypothetical protein
VLRRGSTAIAAWCQDRDGPSICHDSRQNPVGMSADASDNLCPRSTCRAPRIAAPTARRVIW